MHEIETNIHLSADGDIWAFGAVIVDRCMKFYVQVRKYQDGKGEQKSFLSFPRRKGKNGWEDVVCPDRELREEITAAVGEAIKKEMQRDLQLPEPEVINVTPVDPAGYPREARARICGLATVRVCGLTVKGITVKQGERTLFIDMPQYQNGERKYRDIVYGTSRAMQKKITQSVLDAYQKRMGQEEWKEMERKENMT